MKAKNPALRATGRAVGKGEGRESGAAPVPAGEEGCFGHGFGRDGFAPADRALLHSMKLKYARRLSDAEKRFKRRCGLPSMMPFLDRGLDSAAQREAAPEVCYPAA